MLDMMTKLDIDMHAAMLANDENPDFEGCLTEIITDDHVSRAIIEVFKDDPEWTDDLLPIALREYHASQEVEDIARAFSMNFLNSFGLGAIYR